MYDFRLGVDVDDFHLPVKDAIRTAAELKFQAVELAAVSGELAPNNLSDSGRRHLARLVRGFGLDLASLVADIPQTRFTDPHTVSRRVDQTCLIIELARDLGVPLVTASVGPLTHPDTGEPSAPAVEALARIGELADACGVIFAIRPSSETGDRILRVLAGLRCPAIRVGFDPAAMAMAGTNPLRQIEQVAEHIRLFHVRDATAGLADRPGRETRLGEGELDVIGLMAVADAAHYDGPYILRRTDSASPLQDIRDAKARIERELRDL